MRTVSVHCVNKTSIWHIYRMLVIFSLMDKMFLQNRVL